MRSIARYAVFPLILLSVWGCGQKGAKLQKSVVPPDKTLFETGSEYLKKSQYIKARLAFQTLINTYPDSDMAAESYLAIGDSFYNEGGTENYLQAADQYKNFIIFFPTNPKAPDAQMKMISLYMKMMRSPDRDPQYSYKALQEIKKFLADFSDSDYVPIVKQFKNEVEENLAQGDSGVGSFYAGRGNFAGAKSRYEDVIKNYQNYSAMDEIYYQMAQADIQTKNPDEAAIYLGKIVQAWPFSKHFEEAKEQLKSLGKPVPDVDTKLADLNEAKLKPSEGFSPLRPFIDFAEALGFKGPPDRYKMAVKSVQEQKAEAAQAQSAPAESGRPGSDILIQTTLKQNAEGKTTANTVLGSNVNGSAQKTDKNGDKKEDSAKKKKKNDTKKETAQKKP